MKKSLLLLPLVVTFFALWAVSASAAFDDTVRVGLRYGSSAMSSANLENDEGSGYEFGYFEADGTFVSLDETDETAITMSPAGRTPLSPGLSRSSPTSWAPWSPHRSTGSPMRTPPAPPGSSGFISTTVPPAPLRIFRTPADI